MRDETSWCYKAYVEHPQYACCMSGFVMRWLKPSEWPTIAYGTDAQVYRMDGKSQAQAHRRKLCSWGFRRPYPPGSALGSDIEQVPSA